jgi:hypothetical protein
VLYVGRWWIWTHAVLPVDDRLDMPAPEQARRVRDQVANCISRPHCRADEEALVVLRRPGPAVISQADAYLFRMVCEAVTGRETAPWTFYVTTPERARECFRQRERR